MTDILISSHSGLRWVVLILLLASIFNAFSRKSVYEERDIKLYKFTMIFTHVQFTLGLVLYFLSSKVAFTEGWMKVSMFRFFGMEHLIGMLLAVLMITFAKSKAAKADSPEAAQKKARMFFVLGLVIIIAFIPWPFREALGGSWF